MIIRLKKRLRFDVYRQDILDAILDGIYDVSDAI